MGEPDLDDFGVRQIDGGLWICRGFERLMCCDALKIAGDHNIANVLAALALGSALDLPMAGLLKGAAGFRGLPHRCQLVRKVNGVRYIDDSKGTNVGATEAALIGLSSEGPIWLIMGGQGKGQDFSQLQQVVSERCAGLLVLGQATAEITDCLGRAARIQQVDTVEEAVLRASRLARSGDTVLLSPACASLDMFSNYVERGERFQYAVQALEVAS
jgi:UDP-N-acetylmuramoylalanine--D-glutamate ligase